MVLKKLRDYKLPNARYIFKLQDLACIELDFKDLSESYHFVSSCMASSSFNFTWSLS